MVWNVMGMSKANEGFSVVEDYPVIGGHADVLP
jgi:hypothetical protein